MNANTRSKGLGTIHRIQVINPNNTNIKSSEEKILGV